MPPVRGRSALSTCRQIGHESSECTGTNASTCGRICTRGCAARTRQKRSSGFSQISREQVMETFNLEAEIAVRVAVQTIRYQQNNSP